MDDIKSNPALSTVNANGLRVHHTESCKSISHEPEHRSGAVLPETTFKVDEFCSRITCHGINDWYQSSTYLSRWFWASIFLGATAVLIFSLYESFRDFYINPIITTISVAPATSMQFPSIYICPSNFVNKTYLSWSPKTMGVIEIFNAASVTDNGLLGYRNRTVSSLQSEAAPPRDFGFVPKEKRKPTLVDRQREIFAVSLDTDKFVKECSFQWKKIDCMDRIKKVLDKDYGVCYQIDIDKRQALPGAGLSLVLDLHTELAPTNAPLTDGATVSIRNETHDTSESSTLISPGTQTQILLKETREELITVSKFSKTPQLCANDDERKFVVLNVSYSCDACQFDCLQHQLFDSCKCLLPTDISHLRKEYHKMENFCSKSDYRECALPLVEGENRSLITDCKGTCYKRCRSVKYDMSSSFKKFPSRVLRDGYATSAPTSNQPPSAGARAKRDIFADANRWQDNYIILDIAFAQLEITTIEQSPAMTPNTLLSNVGGQCGLWLGASLFTLLQFIVFAVKLCVTKVRKGRVASSGENGTMNEVKDGITISLK